MYKIRIPLDLNIPSVFENNYTEKSSEEKPSKLTKTTELKIGANEAIKSRNVVFGRDEVPTIVDIEDYKETDSDSP